MDELQQLAATCPAIPYARGIFSTSIPLDENTIIYKAWEMPDEEQKPKTIDDHVVTVAYIMRRFGDLLIESGYITDVDVYGPNQTESGLANLAQRLTKNIDQQVTVVRNQIEAARNLLSSLSNKDMVSAYISLIMLKYGNAVIESSWMYGWEEWINNVAQYILENATKNELEEMEDLL